MIVIFFSGMKKLELTARPLVFLEDGTEIDDDECLQAFSDSVLILAESWSAPAPNPDQSPVLSAVVSMPSQIEVLQPQDQGQTTSTELPQCSEQPNKIQGKMIFTPRPYWPEGAFSSATSVCLSVVPLCNAITQKL